VNGEREGEVREAGSRVPSPAVRLLAVAAAGYLYGSLSARVPGTSDPTAFWVGNLAAPYLLIPFLAGTWRFRAIGSAVAGAAAAVSAVAGFYRFLIVWHTTSANLGLAADTPTRTVIARAYGYWFRNLALGDPGGRPWLSIALVAGTVCGYLGYRWADRRSRVAALAITCAFVLEPLGHFLGLFVEGGRYTFHLSNVVIWTVEAAIGVLASVWVWRRGEGIATV